ncbi:unnamed protein product [Cylindrotheca closterium]|uniref:PDZ domain-containing protein n=1 Tax=Cylindrotheca closterium TaxID=2856 RepID=A0AAD2CST1_9STRA|nr:unnamed protein product [Cylindrotheca closterium]
MRISVQCLLLALAFTAANAQTNPTIIGVVQENATTQAPKQQVMITGAPVSVPTTSAPVHLQNTMITGAPVSVPTNTPVTPINTVITGAPVALPTRAPVQNTVITGAPVPVVTTAPVPLPTVAPVNPPTAAPVNPPTLAPVNPPTAAPVNPPTLAPVSATTVAPVNPPTIAPVNPPTIAPVSATTVAPVNPPTIAPVNPPTIAPVNPPTDAPVNPPTNAPVNPPTNAPVVPQPTAAPVPTGPPTGAPTESPAPSPSPSAIPTVPPTFSIAPTDRPTGEPTESPAPSPAPSAVPTNLPTTLPSIAPSGNPTLTFKPSETPTQTFKPSTRPTGTPSKLPTGAPSVEPTQYPTGTPSVLPTSEPTEEAFKTKISHVKLVLVDIEREMNDDQLEQFEIATLEFVNDTAPHTDGFEIDVLAVTVVSQNVIYADVTTNETDKGERRTKTAAAALEVSFKTVGLVTEGRAPYDFDFKRDIVSFGFENHMNHYNYILGNRDPFFEPLLAHTDIQGPVEEDEGKFVAAVVLSVIAFLVAVFASVYAIRRHLRAKNRRRNRQHRLSEAHKSNTYSDHSTDDSDEENPFKPPLSLEISPGKMELENVPITPRSIASPYKQEYRNGEASPMSPDTPKHAEPTVLEETGNAIRKWLTPRVASPNANEFKDAGKPPKPASSPDPMALKARTTDATGTFTKGGNSTKNVNTKPAGTMFGQSPLTIPMSFFGGQNTDGESESETPMGSLADSAASSFFNRVGKSVFTGRPSSDNFLKARDRFSPKANSFDDGEPKRNNSSLVGRSRSASAVPKKSLLNEEIMKKHRSSYQPSEVSDVSLNEFKGDKYNTLQAPSSVVSSRASQFSSNTLGARARESTGTSDDNSLNALRSKPESFDVFAPSGPIGIVVDTSKDGPAVHSLKSTSPMLGLINPGDLIIALDDEDTRKMTAASLTRLMAKKSRQKERKITLLSLD